MKWRILSVLWYHDNIPKKKKKERGARRLIIKAQQSAGAEEECWEIFWIQILFEFKRYKLLRVSRQRDYR